MEDEVIDTAEEAAFESGFNGTDLEPAAQEETPAAEVTPEQPAEEAPAEKALTIDDLRAMIEDQKQESQKTRDKLFGKVGELQQKIDAARSSASGISAQARVRLEADFPELAEMLFDKGEAPAYVPPSEKPYIPETVGVESVKQEFERKLLVRDHRDWEKVVTSAEFDGWRQSVLSPEESAQLDETWDSDFVSSKITDFKAWQAGQVKKQAEDKQKKERLESAVVPRGVPRAGTASYGDDDEESAMLSAYGRK